LTGKDAQNFKEAVKKGIKFGENTISADVFKKHTPALAEKKNIYLKDYKQADYTAEQLKDETFLDS